MPHSGGGSRFGGGGGGGRSSWGGGSSSFGRSYGSNRTSGSGFCIGLLVAIILTPIIVLVSTLRSSSPSSTVAVPDRANYVLLSPFEQFSTKVPTPFFYDTVSFSNDSSYTTPENLRFSIFTRSDSQQPNIARVKKATRRETISLSIAAKYYKYWAFPGLLQGSQFECNVTRVVPVYARNNVVYTAYYFPNASSFNAWASSSHASATPFIARTRANMTQFSLTTKVDSSEQYFVFENLDFQYQPIDLRIDCDLTAMLFDTSQGICFIYRFMFIYCYCEKIDP